jgi:hypothetical protein
VSSSPPSSPWAPQRPCARDVAPEAAAGADAGSLLAVGQSLVALHHWTFLLGPGFVVGIGNGLILGYLMYRSGLVPRGMAVLGLIAGPVLLARFVGILFGVFEPGSVLGGLMVARSSCGSCRSASG